MLPFTKASACGNDFLIVEAEYAPADLGPLSRRLCDRHNGVGADGVEWLLPSDRADIRARLINADGGEAEISGNGTRCVAAYLVANGNPSTLSIETGAGPKRCELISRHENLFEFEMDMGRPEIGEAFSMNLSSGKVRGTPVSMGNPQFTVFVRDFPRNWQADGGEIQRHFEQGVNVDFVRVKSRSEIEVRFFERGVGETQSSGTGSCASAVAAIAAGLADSPLSVKAPGGTQIVRWSGGEVFLRGTAQLVFRGEFLG